MSKITKTEHAGAKNGGGYWGKRAEAKTVSNSKRRHIDKQDAQVRVEENDDCLCEGPTTPQRLNPRKDDLGVGGLEVSTALFAGAFGMALA